MRYYEIESIIISTKHSVPNSILERALRDKLIDYIVNVFTEKIETLESELISSRPNDDEKIFTFKECKARQIELLDNIVNEFRKDPKDYR